MNVAEWLAFSKRASWYAARERAKLMGIGIQRLGPRARQDARRLLPGAGWPRVFCHREIPGRRRRSQTCCGWKRTPQTWRRLDEFAEAIHAEFPDKMLAYDLSPSFNWDTTGMTEDEMKRFPEELGKLGFVFNFITYGGHQIDGLA